MNSTGTDEFWAMYRSLPFQIRQAARQAYQLFMQDRFSRSLRFHRLKYDSRFWSVRITRGYRAVGAVEGNDVVWFWIGTHSEFDRDFAA